MPGGVLSFVYQIKLWVATKKRVPWEFLHWKSFYTTENKRYNHGKETYPSTKKRKKDTVSTKKPSKYRVVLIGLNSVRFSSVQFSCSVVSDSLGPRGLKDARLPCPSPAPGACSNSCPSSQWCVGDAISSSVVPFSACLQSFPASGSFPMSQFFTSGGQSIGVSASASVLPVNIQDWFPLRWTGCISLQSKRLSKVFTNIAVQKHQFFSAQLSL